MKGIITGNGSLADDPKNGTGVQHTFDLFEEVTVVEQMRNEKTNVLIRYLCRDSKGKEQLVMIEHFKEG